MKNIILFLIAFAIMVVIYHLGKSNGPIRHDVEVRVLEEKVKQVEVRNASGKIIIPAAGALSNNQ